MSNLANEFHSTLYVRVHTSSEILDIALLDISGVTMSNGLRREGEIRLKDGRTLSVYNFDLGTEALLYFESCEIPITVIRANTVNVPTRSGFRCIASCIKNE